MKFISDLYYLQFSLEIFPRIFNIADTSNDKEHWYLLAQDNKAQSWFKAFVQPDITFQINLYFLFLINLLFLIK